MKKFDVIIIGTGPAGMTSALYTSRAGLSTLLLSRGLYGGQMNNTAGIENYPGFSNILGSKLGSKMKNSTTRFGVNKAYGDVKDITLHKSWKIVTTDVSKYMAKSVVIATGAVQRKLHIPGEKELAGKGVSYCAVCDANFFKNQPVCVVGGGDSAFTEAIYLSHIVSHVTIFIRKSRPQAEHAVIQQAINRPNISVIYNTEVTRIFGKKAVTSIIIHNNKSKRDKKVPLSAIFIYIGMIPSTSVLSNLNKKHPLLTKDGWIKCDSYLQTCIPGIFAIGDVKSHQIRQVATAVGDGASVAHWIYNYVQSF